VQAIVGSDMQLGPTNREAKLPADVAEDLIYGPERVARLVRFDYDVVGQNIGAWIDRWNREIAR
jgi:ABC-type thiamine transport system substrate-binding protein